MLPISTRSCGFLIRNLVVKLQRLSVMDTADLYILANALYRVTLFQIDYKIEEAFTLIHPRDLVRSAFEDTYLTGDMRRALELMGAGFSPLVNYISSIGLVKTTNVVYLPRHPKLSSHSCSPYFLRTSNIRSTLERIASASIDNVTKQRFYENCPIPGAKWTRTAATHTAAGEVAGGINLNNVDDIWPANYGLSHLRADINIIAAGIERVGRKYPKYVSTGGVDWRSVGSVSQIVSTAKANICCPPFPVAGDIGEIKGEHSHFWTPGQLSDPEAYMGVVYLFGEVEHTDVLEPRCFCHREMNSGINDIDLDYASVVQNLIN